MKGRLGINNMQSQISNLLNVLICCLYLDRSEFPTGVENTKCLNNTCEGVHLLKLLPISQQTCNFTENELPHTYFSRTLARF